jgi:hypothetical protein
MCCQNCESAEEKLRLATADLIRVVAALREMVNGCQYGEYDSDSRDRAVALLSELGAP